MTNVNQELDTARLEVAKHEIALKNAQLRYAKALADAEKEMKTKAEGEHVLTTAQLAKRWRMSAGSIANWRVGGQGPKFVKLAKRVLYRLREVEAYELEHLKRNTV